MAILENQFCGAPNSMSQSRNLPEGQYTANPSHKLGDLSQIQQPTLAGTQESQLFYDPETQILYTKGDDGTLV
jgi:hypothetical protein